LCKDRQAKLESIGFRFGRKFDWDTRFEQLVQYKRLHGNCDVPSRYKLNPQLGGWVFEQRRCRNGKYSLRKDRRAKLESIGFMFVQGKKSDGWDTFFEDLRDYLRKHGDCDVPEKYCLHPLLGTWVRKQRHDYSLKCGGDQSAMTAEHEAKLNVLGFSWVKSSTGSNDNNNNVLCPDEVKSKSLLMKRQRTTHDIPTEVRSNGFSSRDGD
jgi:hypothetical protein